MNYDKNGCRYSGLIPVYCYSCNPNNKQGRMEYTGEFDKHSSKYNNKICYWYKCIICNYKMDYDRGYIEEWKI